MNTKKGTKKGQAARHSQYAIIPSTESLQQNRRAAVVAAD